MVAGAAPGLQIRVSGRRTFRGVFDSHASPPLTKVRIIRSVHFGLIIGQVLEKLNLGGFICLFGGSVRLPFDIRIRK